LTSCLALAATLAGLEADVLRADEEIGLAIPAERRSTLLVTQSQFPEIGFSAMTLPAVLMASR
jgi:hypothetical protein